MTTSLKHFRSDRKFVVYSYGAGHGPLLLRSGKTEDCRTRIDVLILDVRALEVRSWSQGIEISQTDQSYLGGFQSNPLEMIEDGLCVYAITGRDWKGFILGGKLFVHEDEAEFGEPSGLLASPS